MTQDLRCSFRSVLLREGLVNTLLLPTIDSQLTNHYQTNYKHKDAAFVYAKFTSRGKISPFLMDQEEAKGSSWQRVTWESKGINWRGGYLDNLKYTAHYKQMSWVGPPPPPNPPTRPRRDSHPSWTRELRYFNTQTIIVTRCSYADVSEAKLNYAGYLLLWKLVWA